ncbi:MAG: 30S ribosomal protein S20 [Planctomycetes bacterium]|nr:30S ribosomal protein S20 [Planctomycetota bacterium]
MAHSKQALKRARQGETRRIRNKAKMTRVKSAIKALLALCQAGDMAKAKAMLPKVCKAIDKAAQTHVIHKNTASRNKSLVGRAVAALK